MGPPGTGPHTRRPGASVRVRLVDQRGRGTGSLAPQTQRLATPAARCHKSSGHGDFPKVIVAASPSSPSWWTPPTGLAATPPELLDPSRSYRASAFKTFLKVRLPMALPFIFAGAKVAITLSVIGAVVGEFVGSDQGLGYVILSATSYWKTELAFSSMILLSLMAILLFGAVSLVERLTCPWLATAGEE
jgi:NitT/TauT family transport system permease protein